MKHARFWHNLSVIRVKDSVVNGFVKPTDDVRRMKSVPKFRPGPRVEVERVEVVQPPISRPASEQKELVLNLCNAVTLARKKIKVGIIIGGGEGLHGTEVAYLLLTQQPRVQFPVLLKLSMLVRLINRAG